MPYACECSVTQPAASRCLGGAAFPNRSRNASPRALAGLQRATYAPTHDMASANGGVSRSDVVRPVSTATRGMGSVRIRSTMPPGRSSATPIAV